MAATRLKRVGEFVGIRDTKRCEIVSVETRLDAANEPFWLRGTTRYRSMRIWGTRLLTGGLLVRVQPEEPILSVSYGFHFIHSPFVNSRDAVRSVQAPVSATDGS